MKSPGAHNKVNGPVLGRCTIEVWLLLSLSVNFTFHCRFSKNIYFLLSNKQIKIVVINFDCMQLVL
jgi:hypothetical protein